MTTMLLFVAMLGAASETQAQTQAQAPPITQPAKAPDTYAYDPSGRRDPFLALLGGTGDSELPAKRVEGLAGLATGEIAVRGVLQGRVGMLAMVQGPDKRTYLVHAGEKLLDGTVKSISAEGLVIVQDVNDPLSLVKQREVRKTLRAREDSRQ